MEQNLKYWAKEYKTTIYALEDPKLEYPEEIEEGWMEDYIPLPHEYNMMEDFVYEHTNGKAQEQLVYAMQGRGAFRRFKDNFDTV